MSPVRLLITVCTLFYCSQFAIAQMGGGGAPGGSNVPLFDEPKFRDRVYEAGGPQFDSKSGLPILLVTIEGNATVSQHKIVSHMQSRIDRNYDQDTFNRDIGELYRTGLFEKIEPFIHQTPEGETPQGVHIRLIVREKPTVKSVTFHGNQPIDDRQLKKHCGLDVGDPTGPSAVNAARSRILEYFQDQGFNNADVQVVSGNKPGERDIVFKISEGELERTWEIKFVGNVEFSSALLKAKIKSRDSRYGVTAYAFNKASPESAAEDKDRLLNYYRSLGYFDARVDHVIDYDDKGKWIYLTFVISEGKRYNVRNVEVAGNQYYKTDEIMPLFRIQKDEPFNQSKKNHDERLIRDLYGERGFIFADIVGQVKYLPENQVDILYSVAEGDVYRASDVRIHIEGDGHTKRDVVLTKIGDVRPGRIISSVDMEVGERNLAASSIFNINPADGGPPRIEVLPPDEVDSIRR
ncbi:MAG: POTRA domain-containing protein [Pirellulaceae bacterium]|nr:POTRA domain-containing protein [Pirellulaceae bacterium]